MAAEDRRVGEICLPGACAPMGFGVPPLCPDGATLVVRAGPDACRSRVWSAR